MEESRKEKINLIDEKKLILNVLKGESEISANGERSYK